MLTEELRHKLWKICRRTPFESSIVIRPELNPAPINLVEYFPSSVKSLFLELGSGWGEVVIELAKRNPSTGYIAFEKKWNRLKQTEVEASKLGLENIALSGINFQWFLEDLFLYETFDTILLNFPDPWPKKKHFKNRSIQIPFLELIYNLLKPGGKFLFATDHGGYARWSIRKLREFEKLKWKDQEYSFERKDFPISEFEKEKRDEGKRIYYLDRFKA
ncbi:tRNA (guanine(46)-N(7))-methyltransferase TrmB [Leptospira sp. GIMC2001]|uniref:tRNA (guanine(46)-N(7))-methyltransferase TrmB n=1 Tax=Leptospira sp. GIMC2001 TaxID=1513297 RepID=UPI00234979CA|nr:Rossmann-like fold-containing protein [Leptospira sp. GIMC2001]WCL50202.1 methyltransferase domain-containing protein [Leptospira sp. GIMC2001]